MKPLLTVLLSAIIFCSCQSKTGSGNIITQTRSLSKFEGVKTSGSIDIEVMNEQDQSVKVEADDNILPYIITEVEDGTLRVYYKPNISLQNTNAKVYVSTPILQKLMVSGSGSITSKGTLKDADHIEIKTSSSGDIDALVDAPSIIAGVSGSGSINLQGRTKTFNGSTSSRGDLKCKNLLSENVAVKVSGSGSAYIFASVHLDAKTSGSGDIYYSGNPQSPQIKTSGSGSVQAEK
ncbi:MAG TPA: head GIN domain-containing protein [Chitinophagaceae bacterium]|nr:head GIN domain-containing protein [Chitinophagaceae bacterium]